MAPGQTKARRPGGNPLKDEIASLQVALSGYQYSEIEPLYQKLNTDFLALQNYMAQQTQNGNGG